MPFSAAFPEVFKLLNTYPLTYLPMIIGLLTTVFAYNYGSAGMAMGWGMQFLGAKGDLCVDVEDGGGQPRKRRKLKWIKGLAAYFIGFIVVCLVVDIYGYPIGLLGLLAGDSVGNTLIYRLGLGRRIRSKETVGASPPPQLQNGVDGK